MPYEPVTKPSPTREGRLVQYIDAIINHDYTTYTIRDLRLRGSIWSACSVVLREAGLIDIEEKRPNRIRYKILASDDELLDWLESRCTKAFLAMIDKED
jgi:DNA-binding transcriptional ArsR family regulator